MRALRVSNARRILERAGAQYFGYGAIYTLMKVLDGAGLSIAERAIEFANYAGRVTVKAVDIDIATRKSLRELSEHESM